MAMDTEEPYSSSGVNRLCNYLSIDYRGCGRDRGIPGAVQRFTSTHGAPVSLTREEVLHVAKLAALELSDDEVTKYQRDLSEILDYVATLREVSSRGVPPTLHVHGETNAFRDDIVRDSFPVEKLDEFAPDFAGGCFRVPRIIG